MVVVFEKLSNACARLSFYQYNLLLFSATCSTGLMVDVPLIIASPQVENCYFN